MELDKQPDLLEEIDLRLDSRGLEKKQFSILTEQIKEKLKRGKEVRGIISYEEGPYVQGMGINIIRKYDFFGGNVIEKCVYPSRRNAEENVLDDAIENLKISIDSSTLELGRRKSSLQEVIIRSEDS